MCVVCREFCIDYVCCMCCLPILSLCADDLYNCFMMYMGCVLCGVYAMIEVMMCDG